MADWDSPERSRMFLVAALLTATFGFFATSEVGKWDAPQLAQPVPMNLGTADQERAAAAAAAGAEGSPEALAGEFAAAVEEPLRDALAPLAGAEGAQIAARTASFHGPAGRVPGAFAPAGAQVADAAARRMSNGRIEPAAGAAGSSGSEAKASGAAAKSWARPAEPEGGRDGAPAVAAFKGGAARELTPGERLFERPSAGSARTSLSGRAAAKAPAAAVDAVESERRAARRRKISLASLLGKGALKAPQKLAVPSFKPWNEPQPQKAPALGEPKAELVTAPPACSKGGKHWDENADGRWHHDGSKRGRLTNDGWTWLRRHDGRWWQWPSPKSAPLVRHQDHWWLQSRGAWFLLHDGEPWGFRHLSEWAADGLVHASGAQLIYSSDGARLAVVIPGDGAVIYDAFSGAELHRWAEAEMPRRAAPRSLPKN